jgi:hypothetical protein
MSSVDLSMVSAILARAAASANGLHGSAVADRDQKVKNSEHAALTRQLLVLADNLELAANLVRNEYWISKGYDDALEAGVSTPAAAPAIPAPASGDRPTA